MKVMHFHSGPASSGSTQAVVDLHLGLRDSGVESVLACNISEPTHIPGVVCLPDLAPSAANQWIKDHYLEPHLNGATQSGFTLIFRGKPIPADLLEEADLLHLHSVAKILDPSLVSELLRAGKPVVWTLHDHWPMTGGCHSPGECRRFEDSCKQCPLLGGDEAGLVAASFQDRLNYFGGITVIAPNASMADAARKSRIFREARIETFGHFSKLLVGQHIQLYTELLKVGARIPAATAYPIRSKLHDLLPDFMASLVESVLVEKDAENNSALAQATQELQAVRRDLESKLRSANRRIKRMHENVGYRISHGITRGLRAIAGVAAAVYGPRPKIQFSAGQNKSGSRKACSAELKKLVAVLAGDAKAAFFLGSTNRNWQLQKIFARFPVAQLCLADDLLLQAIKTGRFFAQSGEFQLPDGRTGPALGLHDIIVIETGGETDLGPLFRTRLWPHQKVLVHGAPEEISKVFPDRLAFRQGSDFALYSAPPLPWLDPAHDNSPSSRPWKSGRKNHRLPSGGPLPRISVVTPSFNQGEFIQATIDSVFTQDYPNLEYLLLDAASTDSTTAIIEPYKHRFAYCCSEKDNGQAHAINKGLARSSGEIMAWLNSDDQYAAGALLRVAATFDQFPDADLVVGGCGILRENESRISSVHHCALPLGRVVPLPLEQLLDLDSCWLKGHFFYQPEVFWRRRIWNAVGGAIAEDLFYSFDYDLWVRMAKLGARIVHIPETVAIYRVHPGQKTFGADLPYVPELRRVNARLTQPTPKHAKVTTPVEHAIS